MKYKLTDNDWNQLLKFTPYEYVDYIKTKLNSGRHLQFELLKKILFGFALNDTSYSQCCLQAGINKIYRARIYDYTKDSEQSKSNDSPFKGYNYTDSFVPPARVVPMGRINRKNEIVLYASSHESGAIEEINPCVDNIVSVAEIDISENIYLFDIAHVNIGVESDNLERTNWLQQFILAIAHCFYRVQVNYDDYRICHYIAHYIKSIGFDGIAYYSSKNSSLIGNERHINYAIFNYYKCAPISSSLKYITNVTVSYTNY